MAKMIPAAERITRARALIQKARDLPNPAEPGMLDFAYIAEGKEILQKARDLIKFIPYTPTASPEMKAEVVGLFREADEVEKFILHGNQKED